ncbi:YrdB family protein [Longispora sp. NPDC051575]|uniref:YrdB family protein n=1 Tax=Longispora sp. NPDC051575 TaxID=3154943 RepID=UPI003432B292
MVNSSAGGASTPAWNLALRLCLELAALVGFGWAGWHLADGTLALVLAIVGPLVGATLWGVFAVPGDPSRSGNAPVSVPGIVRLLIELLVLFGGSMAFVLAGAPLVGWVLVALNVLHMAFAIPRLRWLVRQC